MSKTYLQSLTPAAMADLIRLSIFFFLQRGLGQVPSQEEAARC